MGRAHLAAAKVRHPQQSKIRQPDKAGFANM